MTDKNKEREELRRAFDAFTEAMWKKLEQKLSEGCVGWREMSSDELKKMVEEHIRKDGDIVISENDAPRKKREEVDIANLCMMIYIVRNREGSMRGG